MREFLSGDRLSKVISEILGEQTCRAAVAFWGKGARDKLARPADNLQLICNLRSGATNPFEIKRLPRDSVRQCDTLHAKVYLGAKRAVVCSANVSSNGLGLEGVEQAHWVEAGVLLDETSEVAAWIEALWENSRPITDDDVKKAKQSWKLRQRSRPPAISLSSFDPDRVDLPLLYWVEDGDWVYNRTALKEQLGADNNKTRALIDDSLEVEPGDREAMKSGTWIVVWQRAASGLPRRKPSPYWFFTGRLINGSFRYKGEQKYKDSVLQADISPDPPFSLKDAHALSAFVDTLSTEHYAELREHSVGGKFFTPQRMELTRKFWKACKKRYVSASAA